MQANVIEIDVKDMDVSEIFARADLRNLTLDKTLIDKYVGTYKSRKITGGVLTNDKFDEMITEATKGVDDKNKLNSFEELKNLSYGEKLALRTYTTGAYKKINGLVRGDYRLLTDSNEVKDAFLDNLVIQNLLTKLNNPFEDPTLRLEDAFRLEDLKNKIPNKFITEDKALVSTGEKTDPTFGGDVSLIFNSGKGLHVSPISFYPHEREVLLAGGQFKFSQAACVNDNGRVIAAVDNMNVDTDERKERAKTSGFDIKKHEYTIHIEPKERKIEEVEFKETTVIKKGSLLQDDGASKATKHDIIKEQPANNADLIKKIKDEPALKPQIEEGLTRDNKILLNAVTIPSGQVKHNAEGVKKSFQEKVIEDKLNQDKEFSK
jgi:hypothetical protein